MQQQSTKTELRRFFPSREVHSTIRSRVNHLLSDFPPNALIAISTGGLHVARLLRTFLKYSSHGECDVPVLAVNLCNDGFKLQLDPHEGGCSQGQRSRNALHYLAGNVLIVDAVDHSRRLLALALTNLKRFLDCAKAGLTAEERAAWCEPLAGVFVLHSRRYSVKYDLPDDVLQFRFFVGAEVEDQELSYPWQSPTTLWGAETPTDEDVTDSSCPSSGAADLHTPSGDAPNAPLCRSTRKPWAHRVLSAVRLRMGRKFSKNPPPYPTSSGSPQQQQQQQMLQAPVASAAVPQPPSLQVRPMTAPMPSTSHPHDPRITHGLQRQSHQQQQQTVAPAIITMPRPPTRRARPTGAGAGGPPAPLLLQQHQNQLQATTANAPTLPSLPRPPTCHTSAALAACGQGPCMAPPSAAAGQQQQQQGRQNHAALPQIHGYQQQQQQQGPATAPVPLRMWRGTAGPSPFSSPHVQASQHATASTQQPMQRPRPYTAAAAAGVAAQQQHQWAAPQQQHATARDRAHIHVHAGYDDEELPSSLLPLAPGALHMAPAPPAAPAPRDRGRRPATAAPAYEYEAYGPAPGTSRLPVHVVRAFENATQAVARVHSNGGGSWSSSTDVSVLAYRGSSSSCAHSRTQAGSRAGSVTDRAALLRIVASGSSSHSAGGSRGSSFRHQQQQQQQAPHLPLLQPSSQMRSRLGNAAVMRGAM